MALGGATFGITLTMALLALILSSMILAYAGGINQKGSADQKAFNPQLRKWLIGIASFLLVFAVVTIVVAIIWYTKDREIVLRQGIAL